MSKQLRSATRDACNPVCRSAQMVAQLLLFPLGPQNSLRLGSFQPRMVSRIAFAAFFWVTDNPAAISSASTADRPSELHSPIREGGCTARFCVSDTRCGTYFIYSVYLKGRYSTFYSPTDPRAWGRVRGSILFPNFLAYRWPTNRPLGRFCRFIGVAFSVSCVLSTRPFVRHLLVVGRHDFTSLRRNSALQGVGALAPTSRAWLSLGFSP
jgi:hypothetical protein